ncbi:DNA-binding transcriptional regulator, MarR family [Amycolatopsis marina]|uniref:DNA-binding transcriptional regulator, MarR family n=1 Tax=Amycolatopsis marina TaxID=490629 RepID=A0A1I1BJ16_9PSEU|nr:MarR family transcriptional regulator [Amycolatopsis marina]SFB48453.1 DNA-binding transcriptional regulator, MarR family [Amycolatopsis marina]
MAEKTPRPPSLLAQPSYLASQVSKFGRRQLEAELAEHELLLGHQAILSALDDFGSLSQQELADALDFDKSHLVGRLDLLVRRGLVSRAQDPSDRRRNNITLTPAGRSLMDTLRPIAVESQQGFLDALSQTERATLIALLQRVLAANDAVR